MTTTTTHTLLWDALPGDDGLPTVMRAERSRLPHYVSLVHAAADILRYDIEDVGHAHGFGSAPSARVVLLFRLARAAVCIYRGDKVIKVIPHSTSEDPLTLVKEAVAVLDDMAVEARPL